MIASSTTEINQKDLPLDLADLAIIKGEVILRRGTYRYALNVKNLGGIPTGTWVGTKQEGNTTRTKQFASLDPGASKLIIGIVGTLPVTFTLDPQNLIKELKEDNNVLTITSPSTVSSLEALGIQKEEGM